MSATRVVFRTFRSNGEVIALFPQLPGTLDPFTCQSYLHVGQHGAASVDLSHATRASKPGETRELRAELERIGYTLDIRTRITRHDLEVRRQALRT